jgi:hypothetical protein
MGHVPAAFGRLADGRDVRQFVSPSHATRHVRFVDLAPRHDQQLADPVFLGGDRFKIGETEGQQITQIADIGLPLLQQVDYKHPRW